MICPKCCWKSEAVAQLSSVKMRFCKTSQISQKTSKMVSLFRKTVNSQACNCYIKKDTVTGVFLWIYYIYVNIFFHFYFFVSKKTKAAIGDILWKKMFLKISQISQENACVAVSFFLIKLLLKSLWKLRNFKSTYFEEHLWATVSKRINTCLIVKVLFLRRIKLLNNNANQKKCMCENLTSEVMWHKNCRR